MTSGGCHLICISRRPITENVGGAGIESPKISNYIYFY